MKKIYVAMFLLLAATVCSFGQDREQAMVLLYDIDEQRTTYEYEIIHIEEFNFGIPGGVNWLVEWKGVEPGPPYISYVSTFMYAVDIDAKKINFRAQVERWREDYRPPFSSSYYENFPGVTRGNGVYQVGDFNGDGFDEIAELYPAVLKPTFDIWGYDPLEGKIKKYCSIPWLPVDDEYQISPVEFIMYKGIQGFQIYYSLYTTEDGNWFFYTWDGEQCKYVNMGVVEPKYIGVDAEPVQKQDEPPPEEELPEEASAVALENERTEEGNAKKGKFIIIIALIIGAVAVGAVIILLVARKKMI